jgi:hypothetical protein
LSISIPLPKPPVEPLVPHTSEGSHWYDRAGVPRYEVVGANGQLRASTLRDGRKHGWVPSFSTVSQCAAAPGLERWKREQLLYASFTLPRVFGESTDAFAKRVVADSEEQGIKARDTGTAIHSAIEKWLCDETYDMTYHAHVLGAARALIDWCGIDGIQAEKSFAHPLGFGGKCDIHKVAPQFIADFKTKDFDEKSLPKIYDNHPMQLGAYRQGFIIPNARGAIIFVSTRVPGLTHLIEIDEDELRRGWNMFAALLKFWQIKNRYDSSF